MASLMPRWTSHQLTGYEQRNPATMATYPCGECDDEVDDPAGEDPVLIQRSQAHRDPQRRYRDQGELSDEVPQCASGTAMARADGHAYRSTVPIARRGFPRLRSPPGSQVERKPQQAAEQHGQRPHEVHDGHRLGTPNEIDRTKTANPTATTRSALLARVTAAGKSWIRSSSMPMRASQSRAHASNTFRGTL